MKTRFSQIVGWMLTLIIKMEVIFEYINNIFNPQEKWEKIVKNDKWELRKVPLEYITQKMCNEAVEKYPCMLEYVPDQFKTREMCLKAVKYDVRLSEYINPFWDEDNDCWDSDFAELLRCKGDDGECKENCWNELRNCHDCHKVVCLGHARNCCWCNGNSADYGMVYCEDCSFKITAYLCKRH